MHIRESRFICPKDVVMLILDNIRRRFGVIIVDRVVILTVQIPCTHCGGGNCGTTMRIFDTMDFDRYGYIDEG